MSFRSYTLILRLTKRSVVATAGPYIATNDGAEYLTNDSRSVSAVRLSLSSSRSHLLTLTLTNQFVAATARSSSATNDGAGYETNVWHSVTVRLLVNRVLFVHSNRNV